jgi:flagellar protein FlaI
MARKKGKGGGKGKRAQQRAQYDELDKYPVIPPHAFARIVRDKQTLNILYQIIEPPLTKKEQEQREDFYPFSNCKH